MQNQKTDTAVVRPRLSSKPELLALLGGNIAYSTVWTWMREQQFPLAIQLGPKDGKSVKIAWREDEVIDWINSRAQRKIKNRTATAAVLLLALLLPTPSPARSATTITGPARVLDGDTVIVGGVTVRLKGVDAAERGSERGENARRVMREIVSGELTCTLTGERTWRREVGYCVTSGGVDINREIIAQGAALSCPRYDARYLKFETEAALAAQPRAGYCTRRVR